MSYFLPAFLKPERLAIEAVAGLAAGLICVVLNISYAVLIFSGEMAPYIPRGIGLFLFGGCVLPLLLLPFGSLVGTVISPQSTAPALLAPAVSALFSSFVFLGKSDAFFPTIFMLIAMSSLMSGLFFFLMGRFKLGNLIRYVPYPVVGGFLAGTGWLLTHGALQMMVGQNIGLAEMSILLEPDKLFRWLPGGVYATVVALVLYRTNHFLVWPSIILTGLLLFYGALLATGLSVEEARAMGLLLPAYSSGELWSPLSWEEWVRVDWYTLSGQMGVLIAISIVNLFGFLLNATALELVTKRDIDLNYELRVTGVVNALAALGGGPSGYATLSVTALVNRMGAGQLAAIIAALVSLVVLLMGGTMINYLPVALLGGLLLALGISFLTDWLYSAFFKLPYSEYLIVWVSLVGIAVIGFLSGVIVGVLFAVLVFTFKYSRIHTVRDTLNGKIYHANVDRPAIQREILHQWGQNIHIFRLQGYIFFGTAEELLARVREFISTSLMHELFIVLDFRHVHGLDSSVIYSLERIHQIAQSHNIYLVFTQVDSSILRLMERGDFVANERVQFFSNLDHGMEWCENRLLEIHGTSTEAIPMVVQQQLAYTFPKPALIDRLMSYLERMDVEANIRLMDRGDRPESMYFVESGRLQVFLETHQGLTSRLRSICGGAVVGEMGIYLKGARTANVMTTEKSVLYRLSEASRNRMEKEDPAVASALHEWIAYLLAERMADQNHSIEALLD